MFVKRRKSVDYLFFIVILTLYFIPRYLEYTTFCNIALVASVVTALKAVSYIFALGWFCIKMLLNSKVQYAFLFVVMPIFVYYTYQSCVEKHNTIFVLLLFSLIFEEKYLKQYISFVLRVYCLLYCVTVLACQFGFIENVITSRNKFGSVWIAGGNGFGYSGQMIMMLIPIVFLYYYKHDGKIKWWDNAFWMAISALVYYRCKTIMGFVLILLFIALYNICSLDTKIMNCILKSKLIKISAIIFAGVSVLLIWLYNKGNAIGQYLDIVVNGRLSVASRVIQIYGIRIMGTDFENNTLDGKYEILDSEYIHMLVSGGILYLLISLFVCSCIMHYVQKQDRTLVLIWLMIFFNAIFNNGILGLVMNPFSILIVPALKSGLGRIKLESKRFRLAFNNH